MLKPASNGFCSTTGFYTTCDFCREMRALRTQRIPRIVSSFAVLVVLISLLALLALPVTAATIRGAVYDFSLEQVNNVVVEVNTLPKQAMVVKNGTYEFTVPIGTYKIVAEHRELGLRAEEGIIVKDEAEYLLDLILLPAEQFEAALIEPDIDLDPFIEATQPKGISTALLIALLAGIAALVGGSIGVWFALRKAKVPYAAAPAHAPPVPAGPALPRLDPDLEKIVYFMRKEGGRTTQKEVRKAVPYSEAKVSLMIAELEQKEIVEKFKKGRGNIIVLKELKEKEKEKKPEHAKEKKH